MIALPVLLMAASSVMSCAKRVKFNPFIVPYTPPVHQGLIHSRVNPPHIQMQGSFPSPPPKASARAALRAARQQEFASSYDRHMDDLASSYDRHMDDFLQDVQQQQQQQQLRKQQQQEDASDFSEFALDESETDELQREQQQQLEQQHLEEMRQPDLQQQPLQQQQQELQQLQFQKQRRQQELLQQQQQQAQSFRERVKERQLEATQAAFSHQSGSTHAGQDSRAADPQAASRAARQMDFASSYTRKMDASQKQQQQLQQQQQQQQQLEQMDPRDVIKERQKEALRASMLPSGSSGRVARRSNAETRRQERTAHQEDQRHD